MRSRRSRRAPAIEVADDEDWDDDDRPWSLLARLLAWPTKDLIGLGLCGIACIAILTNALFLQPGPHPAPLFSRIIPAATVSAATAPKAGVREIPIARIAVPASRIEATGALPVALPRPRPDISPPRTVAVEPTATQAPVAAPAHRTRGELIAEIQRELSRRGFYEGPVDGFYGPRTDAAIRDFEQAARLKASIEPSEVLLAAILRSNAAAQPRPFSAAPVSNPSPRSDGEVNAPLPNRVVAVQRALAEWGYGQIRPTGRVDDDTRAAIEKFERDRRLPITGELSERVTRELTAVTGRPLE